MWPTPCKAQREPVPTVPPVRALVAGDTPEQLVRAAEAAFPGTGMTCYGWDPGAAGLMPLAANDLSRQDGLAVRALGVGASGRAALRRRPVVAGDCAVAFGTATPAGLAGVVVAVSVPLVLHGEVLGTLSVGSDRGSVSFGCREIGELVQVQATLLGTLGWWQSQSVDRLARLAEIEALCDADHRAAIARAYAHTADTALAEQAVADVLLTVWRAGVVYDANGGALSWLLPMVDDRATAVAGHRAGIAESTQDRETRADMPDFLSLDQRSAIDLMCHGGLPYAEAAEWLVVSIARLRSAVRTGLDELRAAGMR